MVAHLLQVGLRIPALGAIRIEFILGAMSFAASVPYWGSSFVGEARRVIFWTSGLFVTLLIWVPLSVDPAASWPVFVDKVLKLAIMSVVTAVATSHLRGVVVFILAYVGSFLKMAQEGVFGIVTGSMIWENQGIPRLHGTTDLYAHPNSFAGTQLTSAAIIANLIRGVRRRWQILLALHLAGALLVVVYCGSRTSYVALIGYMAYLIWTSSKKFKSIAIILIASLIAIQFVPDEYVARFQTISTGQEIEGNSMNTRKVIIVDAIKVFTSHPFGVGVDQFRNVRQQMFGRIQDTHNLYLQIATDIGIFGLFFFSGLIISLIKTLNGLKARLEKSILQLDDETDSSNNAAQRNRQNQIFVHCFVLGLKGFIVVRLFLGLFGHDLYENYWWIAVGATVGLCSTVRALEFTQECNGETPSSEPAPTTLSKRSV